jgi:hypothetical protein
MCSVAKEQQKDDIHYSHDAKYYYISKAKNNR